MTEKTEAPAAPDWLDIRARYEQGTQKVAELAASLGLSGITLSRKAKAEGWKLRAAAAGPQLKTTRAESTRQTLRRLKDILQRRLRQLDVEIGLLGEEVKALNSERDIRAANTLVRTLEKVLELEHRERRQASKRAKNATRLNDAERDELARRITGLCESTQSQNAEPQTEDSRGAKTAVELDAVGKG